MMKKTLAALALLVAAGGQVLAAPADFSAYPAQVENITLKGPLTGANDQIRAKVAWVKAKAQKPNFAGHYVLDSYGCGTGCMATVLVDLRTGAVYSAPFHEPTNGEKSYRADSRLVEYSKYGYLKANSPEMSQIDGVAIWDDKLKAFKIKEEGKPYKMDME